MSRPRVYDGWVIVAGLCVTETISWGILYYGFAVFVRTLEEELVASRAEVTGAFSAGLLVAALAAVPVGRWLDRHGPRGLMTAGSCLGVVLLLAWSRVESLGALYAVWVLMGLALAATLYEPAFGTIVSWFARSRDRALLILTLAAGLASTIFVPAATWLLLRQGWRQALVTLAVILAVTTIPIHALLIKRNPRGAGVERDGDAAEAAASVPVAGALRTPFFWALSVAFFVSNFATVSVTVHLIPFLVERGWAMTTAALTLGWIGAMQLLGRLLFAPIAAWLGHRWVTASIFLVEALAIAQLGLAVHLPTLVPMVVMLGAANGMATLARATTVAQFFGPRHYASIAGALAVGSTAARATGPVGASLLREGVGSYERVFMLLAVGLVLAGLAVLGTPAPGGRSGK